MVGVGDTASKVVTTELVLWNFFNLLTTITYKVTHYTSRKITCCLSNSAEANRGLVSSVFVFRSSKPKSKALLNGRPCCTVLHYYLSRVVLPDFLEPLNYLEQRKHVHI